MVEPSSPLNNTPPPQMNAPPSQANASPPQNRLPMFIPDDQLNAASQEKTPSGNLSSSPWAKMFPSGATEEQLKMFIQCFVKDLMTEVKKGDDRHRANLAEQKKKMEENS